MIYAIVIQSVVIVVLLYLIYKLLRRCLEFDALFNEMYEHLSINCEFLKKFLSRDMFSKSDEVVALYKNARMLVESLLWYSERVKSLSTKDLLNEKIPNPEQVKPRVI